MISGPRAWRFIFFGRLIWRCRRWEGYIFTLPLPVSLKRFLAPLLVFILGISCSSGKSQLGSVDPGRTLWACPAVAVQALPQRDAGLYSGRRGVARPRPVDSSADGRRTAGQAGPAPLPRRQDHHHLAAFKARELFDLGGGIELEPDPFQHLGAQLLVH